jgi:hypothetical protein
MSFHSSSQFGDMGDFDRFVENYDNGRTENHLLETKLNYHSYMNKQARAKWSKCDTDLFYQVFGNQQVRQLSVEFTLFCYDVLACQSIQHFHLF